MAILLYNGILGGIRGHIGGVTFSANGSGGYCKSYASGIRSRTTNQSLQKAYIAQMPQYWRDLVQSQRDDWIAWAKLPAQERTNSLGVDYHPNGWNYFAGINAENVKNGKSILLDAPTDPWPAAPTLGSVNYSENGVTWFAIYTFPAAMFGANDGVIFARAVPSVGITYAETSFLQQGYWPVPDPGDTTFNFKIGHGLTFGIPVIGWRIFVHIHQVSPEGLRSQPLILVQDFTLIP